MTQILYFSGKIKPIKTVIYGVIMYCYKHSSFLG